MGLLTLEARQRYCQTLVGDTGLRLREKEGTLPHTDGKTLFVPPFPEGTTPGDEMETSYFYLIIHEARA